MCVHQLPQRGHRQAGSLPSQVSDASRPCAVCAGQAHGGERKTNKRAAHSLLVTQQQPYSCCALPADAWTSWEIESQWEA